MLREKKIFVKNSNAIAKLRASSCWLLAVIPILKHVLAHRNAGLNGLHRKVFGISLSILPKTPTESIY